MSDEDIELRDLVAQTLEGNGVLNKIRAELRANVFLALEEQDAVQQMNVANRSLSAFLETKEGHQGFSLIREFLQFFNLDFTLAVLEPESNCVGKSSSREDLKNQFNLTKCDATQPLLMEFLNKKIDGPPVSPLSTSFPSPSPKKSGSKIPRRVKSPVDSKNGEPNPSEKRILISPDDLDDNEDELLKELGVSPISFNVIKKDTKKPSWLDADMSIENTPKKASDLGSLKDAPPLPGMLPGSTKNEPGLSVTSSPEWDDLLKIDEKISELGFELPMEDSLKEEKEKETRYSYDDDFLSLEKSDDKLSITEEIDGDLSIGSFAGSKGDELCTTDETVSQIGATTFDYGEDVVELKD